MGATRTKEKNHGIEEESDQETQEGQAATANEASRLTSGRPQVEAYPDDRCPPLVPAAELQQLT
jgi:hypothetical protein